MGVAIDERRRDPAPAAIDECCTGPHPGRQIHLRPDIDDDAVTRRNRTLLDGTEPLGSLDKRCQPGIGPEGDGGGGSAHGLRLRHGMIAQFFVPAL